MKTFVQTHDVDHGVNLKKAGATMVVLGTLEPSLQLAIALLAHTKLPPLEIAQSINEFQSRHLFELAELSELSGNSLGYGYFKAMGKARQQLSDPNDVQNPHKSKLLIQLHSVCMNGSLIE